MYRGICRKMKNVVFMTAMVDAPDYLDIKISQEINRNQKTIVIRND